MSQFIINLVFTLNLLYLSWQIWDRGKKLEKILGEVETELSQSQKKMKELEKQLELLKSERSK